MKKDSINTHFIQYRTQIRTIAKSKIKFICMIVIKLQLEFNLKNFSYELYILILLIVMLILKLSYILCIFILGLYKHDLISLRNR